MAPPQSLVYCKEKKAALIQAYVEMIKPCS